MTMPTMDSNGESSIAFKQSYNPQLLEDFDFSPPQSAPIFRPTPEQFRQGPLEYIRQIRSEAEKFGICKIIPPAVSFKLIAMKSIQK
jgi:hypothetical protein